MTPTYDPHAIEARRQALWRERKAFRAPPRDARRRDVYVKAACPFTSGELHVGHARSYSIADAYARFRRLRGDAVLFSMGFDAFGLPAELKAIAEQQTPSRWVEQCYRAMLRQFERMGFSFDWDRIFVSCDEDNYRWSQWLFLEFLQRDLVYRQHGSVDWCGACATTLAAQQVEERRCGRCGEVTTVVERPQWYLRYSRYVRENEERLDDLREWDAASVAVQRTLLGRVDGVEFEARTADGDSMTIFTPHAEAVASGWFVMVSPRCRDIDRWVASAAVAEEVKRIRSAGWQRGGRGASVTPALNSGCTVEVVGSRVVLPVVISPVVDGRFGSTAVLGIPSVDRTDAVVSRRLGLEAPQVADRTQHACVQLHEAVRYRSHDFSIGRQRSWGAPIPVVHCEDCGIVPVPVEDLPVRLPTDPRASGDSTPLLECDSFTNVSCPTCGRLSRRETETLDCHFDAMWMWAPVCVPKEDRRERMFSHPELGRWLPASQMIVGTDGGGYVFDQRITAKALRDLGVLDYLEDGEPFVNTTMHGMVTLDGRKMSKHLGNTVDIEALVSEMGADAVRLAVLYAARPRKALKWDGGVIDHCHRWLASVWEYASARLELAGGLPDDFVIDSADPYRARLARWCAAAVRSTTDDLEALETHRAVRNTMRLFERIQDFESRVTVARGSLDREDLGALAYALGVLARLLIPLAPHIGEELWDAVTAGAGEQEAYWPK